MSPKTVELASTTGPDGTIYAIGGRYTANVYTLAPGATQWTAGTPLPVATAGLAAVTGSDGTIYAIGGYTPNGATSAVYALPKGATTWLTASDNVPQLPTASKWLAATTGTDGTIYAIGGNDDKGDLSSVYALAPGATAWVAKAPLPTATDELAAATGADGTIYAIGGLNGSYTTDAVEAYDPAADSWSAATALPTATCDLAAVTGADGKIYALGGDRTDAADAYDPATATWTPIGPMPAVAGSLGAALGPDGRVYAIGGYNSSGHNTTQVAAYTPPRTLTSSQLSLTFDGTDPERVTELTWVPNGSTSYVAEGGGTCSGSGDPVEFFGQAYGDAGDLVVRGQTGTWSSNGSAATISSVGAPTCGGSTTPVSTGYVIHDTAAYQNEVQVTRTFHFGKSATSTGSLRAYVPRLPVGTYPTVLYPSTGGTVRSTATSADGSVISDWDPAKGWFADDTGAGSGMLVLRDPGDTLAGSLVVDDDTYSSSNNSDIAVSQPAGGWVGDQTETEYLCFYDPTTWTSAARTAGELPSGCRTFGLSITNLPGSGAVGGGFTPTVTTTGGGATSVTSDTTGVCTVDAKTGTVSYVGVGLCTLTAHVAAGATSPAGDGAAQSFKVGRATPSLSITNLPASGVVGGRFTPTVSTTGDGTTSVSSGTKGVCTVDAGTGEVTFVSVGSCTLTAHVTAGTDFTAADGAPQSFDVGSASPPAPPPTVPLGQSITFPAPTGVVVGRPDLALGASASSGLPVTYRSLTPSVCTVTDAGRLHAVAAGACTIATSQSGNGAYLAATEVTDTFTVGGFTPAGPTRVLDTRNGTGAAKAPVGPGASIVLTVPNLPAGVTAVVLNLTATDLHGAAATFVSACPAAQSLASCRTTSALNVTGGGAVANEVTVPVGPDGRITLYNNAGRIDLVADLAGYLTGTFTAAGPNRVLDTRIAARGSTGDVGPGGTVTVTFPDLPSGMTAVVMNLTGTGLTGAWTTFVSACPAGQPLTSCRTTSALNVTGGGTVANEVTVPVGPDGRVTLYNNAGRISLVVDVAGYLTGAYTAVGPTRILDTRTGTGAAKAPVGPGATLVLTVPNLPAGTTGVTLNLTGTRLSGAPETYVSACPAGQARSSCRTTSVLNATTQDVANEITVPVGPDGRVSLYNNAGSLDLVADLTGYLT